MNFFISLNFPISGKKQIFFFFFFILLPFSFVIPAFTQTLDLWTQENSLTTGIRQRAVGIAIGNYGYVGTGYDISNDVYFNDWWQYDPVADSWTQKGNFANSALDRAVGFEINGLGYIGTGEDGTTAYSSWWEYNPGTDSWTQKADFGGGQRYSATGFSIGGYGYVGTGYNGSSYFNDLYQYDPVGNSWAAKASFPGSARYSAVGFSIGNYGYIGTGWNGSALSDFWQYNPASNAWVQKANVPGGGRAVAVGFSIGTKGYVGTGYLGFPSTQKNDFYEYNPNNNLWTQRSNFGGTARHGAVAFSLNGAAYVGSGHYVSDTKDFWKYTPVFTPPVTFQKVFGGTNDDTDTSYISFGSPTGDGGYIIASTTQSFGNGGSDIYLIKTNMFGDTLWTKTYGNTSDDVASSVKQTGDGGYIIAGSTEGVLASDMLILKINSSGSFQWSKTLGGTGIQRANYAEELSGGGYAVTGRGDAGTSNGCALITLNSSGVQQSAYSISPPSIGFAEGFSLEQDAAGGFILSGHAKIGAGFFDAYLVRTGPSGFPAAPAINFDSPGNKNDLRGIVRQTPDGGFLLCGSTNTTSGQGGYDVFLIKADSFGLQTWSYIYGGTNDDVCRSVAVTSTGKYVIAGFTKSFGAGNEDAFLVCLDSGGNFIWGKTYGGASDEKANSVYETADGGFVLFGESNSFSASGNSDVYMVKTDSIGNSGCNETTINPMLPVSVTWTTNAASATTTVSTTPFTVPQNNTQTITNKLCISCTIPISIGKNNDATCYGNCDGSAVVSAAAGTLPYTYSWSNGATDVSVSNLCAGSHTVTVTDASGCTATDSIIITEPTILLANLVKHSDTICPGSSTTIGANPSGGSPSYTYTWSGGNDIACASCLNTVVSPTASATYFFLLTDSAGCAAIDSVLIIVEAPLINAGADQTICSGASTILNATGGVIYSWFPSAGLNNTSIANPVANPVFTTLYTVIGTDATGCSNKDSMVVTILFLPVISVSSTYDTICSGLSSTTLSASGGLSYFWVPGPFLNDTISVSPDFTTTYTVYVTSINGCTSNSAITIVVQGGFPVPIVSGNFSYCIGDSILPVIAVPPSFPAIVVWFDSTGALIDTGIVFQPSQNLLVGYTGFLAVQGTSDACVSYPAVVTFTVNPLPSANAGEDISICPGHTAHLNASGGTSYLWSPSTYLSDSLIANPSSNPDSTFSYTVAVVDGNNCRNKDSITVYVAINDTCGIHIYNVITPNGDGENEVWWIDGINLFPENFVEIFNRWGNSVWSGKNYDNRKIVWHGQNKDEKPLPSGTYYYVIDINNLGRFSKWVELLR